MRKKDLVLPQNLVDLLQTILVTNEEICSSFHESFNWDFTKTWVVLTTYRIIVIHSLPSSTDIEDFRLTDINLELRRDNIGPYDTIEFKSTDTLLFEIAVLHNRREEAQRFIHEVSENMQIQAMSEQPAVSTEPESSPKKINTSLIRRCTQRLHNLRQMGAISEKELKEEIKNNPECEDIT